MHLSHLFLSLSLSLLLFLYLSLFNRNPLSTLPSPSPPFSPLIAVSSCMYLSFHLLFPLVLIVFPSLTSSSPYPFPTPSHKKNANAYELLNLRALKISMSYKNHVFQCMGKIFCVEFQRVPLKFHTKYLTHALKDTCILFTCENLRALGFKSS